MITDYFDLFNYLLSNIIKFDIFTYLIVMFMTLLLMKIVSKMMRGKYDL